MGKRNIGLGRDVTLRDARVKVTGADVATIYPSSDSEQVVLNPEGVLPVFTLYDFGTGSDTPNSRVMTDQDTRDMNKAHRIREKYIEHLLKDPDNTVPIVDAQSTPRTAKS